MPDLESQVVQLEERLAFQEDTIQKLDDALASQQKQLLMIERRILLLTEQLQKLETSLPVQQQDEKPPHY